MAPSLADAPDGPEAIHRRKLEEARAHPGAPLPSNVDWAKSLPAMAGFRNGVLRKPSRTLSGVAIVAVMTAPARCPHGQCTYCPGGVDLGSPQSYTGEEPSALRGAQFHWDAEAIARHRIETLEAIGHPTSKVEVIVMGGTFPARPRPYQASVLQGIYDGLNGHRSGSLTEAQRTNEAGPHRVVGLTVETRPDWCDGRVLPFLLDAGVTRIEIGVECLHDEVLERTGRAHGVGEVERATAAARSRGLKVGYHLMLGLPGMTPADDLADFRRLWAEPGFRPDFLKIYPTLVLPGTRLHDEWRAGRYAPYETEQAADLLAEMKRIVPPWVRIHRIQRDIPARLIAAGVRTSNLRQLARERLERSGARCRCLRCREPGRDSSPPAASFALTELRYPAAGGEERFLALEDPGTDTVGGFLRLRFPSPEPGEGLPDPVIRELKVLGPELAVGTAPARDRELQHRGFGRRLLGEAERQAGQAGFDRLYVTSAVGTRGYYARFGYRPDGPYLAKDLGGGLPTPG
jgi:elongator complex protein 3